MPSEIDRLTKEESFPPQQESGTSLWKPSIFKKLGKTFYCNGKRQKGLSTFSMGFFFVSLSIIKKQKFYVIFFRLW